uniref:Bifunctional inhibitor/plant lipid transfer protein/seed storage helical domain-containing protein n=1 Tax=Brassica oleracea var. oleracea TaxID=109376 RepID=A0A0D3EGR2_BRAOL
MAVFSTVIPLLLLFLSVSFPYVNGNLVLDIECSFVVLNMATCLSFVTIGSQVDKPDALCCSGLKKVLDTKAECLCVGLKKSASMGIKVNITKAATLLAVCKLDAPPTTACSFEIFSNLHVVVCSVY